VNSISWIPLNSESTFVHSVTSFTFASFFNNVLRIGAPGYVPDETDVLRVRQKSVGITETRFNMGQLSCVSSLLSLSLYPFPSPVYTCLMSEASAPSGKSGSIVLNQSPPSSSALLSASTIRISSNLNHRRVPSPFALVSTRLLTSNALESNARVPRPL